MKTIRKLHAEWAEKILPKDAPQVQKQECERAFYSGALSVFLLQMTEVAALPDDKAEEQMSAIHKELEDYFRLMATIPGPHGTERQ